ncbi:helix-turn-helix domain-containing protein [Microbacterium sp. LWO14-1.2]|uniref:helix-turn-helix domain-containing protein n=1 Tax=Microbacterium sp. LWO14-1.2 TaxID=3135263 RepID=UPI0031392D9D
MTYLVYQIIHFGYIVIRMDEYVEAAAGALRAAQARARMTDIALAETSGIPVVTLRRYLKGTRDTPVSALFKIADALGVSAGALLDDASNHVKND